MGSRPVVGRFSVRRFIMDKLSEGDLLAAVRELVQQVKSLQLPAVLSFEDACAQLGKISVPTLKRMIRRGEIRAVPLSGRMGIPRDEIERIARGEVSPKAAQPPKSRRQKALDASSSADAIRKMKI